MKSKKSEMNKLVTNFMKEAKKSKSTVNVTLYYDNEGEEFVCLNVLDKKSKRYESFNFYSFWGIKENTSQLEKAKQLLSL